MESDGSGKHHRTNQSRRRVIAPCFFVEASIPAPYFLRWVRNLMSKTDRVCVRAANRGVRIRCQTLDSETILIEASEEGLKFLGKLLIAQSQDQVSCKKHIAPNGAGKALFTRTSDIGLYIHRVPCPSGRIRVNPRKREKPTQQLHPADRRKAGSR